MKRAREYRWELWLFFGAPFGVWMARALIEMPVHGIWFGLSWPGAILGILLIGGSYLWVRRLARPLLRLVWLYALAAAVVKFAGALLLSALVEDLVMETEGWKVIGLILGGVMGSLLIMLVILVGLAKTASRGGFDKALALIGVSAFPSVGITVNLAIPFFFPFVGVHGIAINAALYLAMAGPLLVGAWVLKQGDMGKAIPYKGFAALFGALCLSSAAAYARFIDWEWGWDREGLRASVMALSVYHAIAIGAAYLVRVRSSDQGPPTERQADRSSLLYGGS